MALGRNDLFSLSVLHVSARSLQLITLFCWMMVLWSGWDSLSMMVSSLLRVLFSATEVILGVKQVVIHVKQHAVVSGPGRCLLPWWRSWVHTPAGFCMTWQWKHCKSSTMQWWKWHPNTFVGMCGLCVFGGWPAYLASSGPVSQESASKYHLSCHSANVTINRTYRLQVTGYSFGRRFYPKRLTSSAKQSRHRGHSTRQLVESPV